MLDRLLRVSELRLHAAELQLQAARSALQAAEAAVQQAQVEQESIQDKIARQRDLAREAFVGSVQARFAVEDMLRDLGNFDRVEAAAQEKVEAALQAWDAAKPPVAEAMARRNAAQIKVEKRRILAQHEADTRRGAQEAAEEADALEQWTAGRTA